MSHALRNATLARERQRLFQPRIVQIPQPVLNHAASWPSPPTPETHLRILERSDLVVLAMAGTPVPRVVGVTTAISDGILAASIPLLEVLPEHRGRGIGRELLTRLLARLDHLHMIDVTCNPNVVPFYTALGITAATGASLRNFQHQVGTTSGDNP